MAAQAPAKTSVLHHTTPLSNTIPKNQTTEIVISATKPLSSVFIISPLPRSDYINNLRLFHLFKLNEKSKVL